MEYEAPQVVQDSCTAMADEHRWRLGEGGATDEVYDLGFLAARASAPERPLAHQEVLALSRAATVFRRATHFVLATGGKAGRIGESVVQTALITATLLALQRTRRRRPPVTIVVDERVRELFAAEPYRQRFWREIEIVPAAGAQVDAVARDVARGGFEREAVLLDFHGAHEGDPVLRSAGHRRGVHAPWRTLHTFESLFGTAVIRFAHRGAERRYADFVETLFSLPACAVDGYEAQPAILLSEAERAEATPMLRRLGVTPWTIPFLCFFQSVAVAKCYDSWCEVMDGVARALARLAPERRVDFLIAYGPNESCRTELDRAGLEAVFGDAAPGPGNARVVMCEIPSLRDLAILATRCITLSNDTGPGHIAAAAGSPVVAPYLPGEVYPARVWAATPRHRGVTVEPSPFSSDEVRQAVLWGENRVISAIPARALVAQAVGAARRGLLASPEGRWRRRVPSRWGRPQTPAG
ncbi:MAG TPA: hypothetical protein VHS99_04045 [Chloroflexota bacterium]|nr:hypothetical protein [Chloroflexota bacterium]